MARIVGEAKTAGTGATFQKKARKRKAIELIENLRTGHGGPTEVPQAPSVRSRTSRSLQEEAGADGEEERNSGQIDGVGLLPQAAAGREEGVAEGAEGGAEAAESEGGGAHGPRHHPRGRATSLGGAWP